MQTMKPNLFTSIQIAGNTTEQVLYHKWATSIVQYSQLTTLYDLDSLM